MKGSFTVEKATPADYPEITRVWEDSVRATHHFLSEADIDYFRPLVLNGFLHTVDLMCTRNDHGQIVGFLGTAGDRLEMLFIKPEYRAKGIGELLLNYATGILGITKVDVNEQNEQAVGFYKKYGFRTTGRSPVDGLGKPYPILHMELTEAPE